MHQLALDSLQSFDLGDGQSGRFYSLPALERAGLGRISRLPVSLRLVLEAVLRHCDGQRITEASVRALAGWQPGAPRVEEIPLVVSRILLQDFTGIPLLVDLAVMRSAVARLGQDPRVIEPLVPVDLVVDHSIQVDVAGRADAEEQNLALEFHRNRERYQFLKWGQQAFKTFRVVPPGTGIVHQVNLEYLAQGVLHDDQGIYYPDSLVGTDSHTPMINGLGILGWGVGGIEAEAGMLGQPIYFLTPDVVGVHLTGALRPGVTATDAVLTVTQKLRQAKVVGKFVEFFGPGAASLPVVDRATLANMAPEYGATVGLFPLDEMCVRFLSETGRPPAHCRTYERYYRAQGLFGMPQRGQIDYSAEIDLDLSAVVPSVAGPKRPQDRIELSQLKRAFAQVLTGKAAEDGFGRTPGEEPVKVVSATGWTAQIGHGQVVIASITSCTNTSNPALMLAAGLLAKKAVARGLRVAPAVKTSLAPGSRVVTDYLERSGLQPYLDQLGFQVVGYGCATCIGNSGPLPPELESAIHQHHLVTAAVLSGNRNFEARIHPTVKANYLMSPPLVIAFALAGRVDLDLTSEPLGRSADGEPVYLRDLWPTADEIQALLGQALHPDRFGEIYGRALAHNARWDEIPAPAGVVYAWDSQSTYIQEPPFFSEFSLAVPEPVEISGARPLAILGDSVTTDHISPAGNIKPVSPAGEYLAGLGVTVAEFNSYGARRGNDRVMTRGTFANLRLKNLLVPGSEGGLTRFLPTGEVLSIFAAAQRYAESRTPLIILAGQEYGTGSSRDWAAKGTQLLGVRAVLARSFERIHRSNLVGMGVLPLQFPEGTSAATLGIEGLELFDVLGLGPHLRPQQDLTLRITRPSGAVETLPVRCRLDTPIEIEYYRQGGILPCVLRQLLARS